MTRHDEAARLRRFYRGLPRQNNARKEALAESALIPNKGCLDRPSTPAILLIRDPKPKSRRLLLVCLRRRARCCRVLDLFWPFYLRKFDQEP